MIERLEVVPGPGSVIRYGNVAAWAGASASPSLVSFLSESARNLASSPVAGDQLADHLVGVLGRRDPEPHVPFIALGPTEEGWTALLHGPVQVWDGTGWIVPSPEPGWLRSRLFPRPALAVSIAGTSIPTPSPDSMWDLESGVVPGGGFALIPVTASGRSRVPFTVPAAAPAVPVEETTVISLADTGPPTDVLPEDAFGVAALFADGDEDLEPEADVPAEEAGPEPAGQLEAGDAPAELPPAAAEEAEQPELPPAEVEPELPPAEAEPDLPPAEAEAELPPAEAEPELPQVAAAPEVAAGAEEAWHEGGAPEIVTGEESASGWAATDGDETPEADVPAAGTAATETAVAAAVAAAAEGAADGRGAKAPAAPAPTGATSRPNVLDLRSAEARSSVVPYPPLPPAGDPPRPVAGAPVVAGVPCPRGHLNRPGMPSCARCGRAIEEQRGYQVSGTRPALGCLITDEGSVYRLDSGYLVGSDPARDPTVRGRLARPLVLGGVDVAPSHAEIRLHDWDVVVTDRSSDGGTYVFEPGAAAWERIRSYEPRVLPPGTHLAFGQRVVTFVTPWTAHTAGSSDGSR